MKLLLDENISPKVARRWHTKTDSMPVTFVTEASSVRQTRRSSNAPSRRIASS